MKGSIAIDAIDAASLSDYAGIVGRLLAKGHAAPACIDDRWLIGSSDKLDRPVGVSQWPTRPAG